MSRKLNTIEMMTAAEGDARSQMHQELSGEKQPFAFSKNVLSRAQLNELFSTKDIKKLKLAKKRNSVPCASGEMLQSKKRELSHSTSKKRKPFSNQALLFGNLNSGLGGLVLEAWPMTNRKASVFNLTNDPSKTKQSTIDRSSIDTLPTESILPRAKVNQE